MGSKGVKVAIIVVAFLAAGIILYSSFGSEAAPAIEGDVSYTQIICQACGEHYQETPEKLATIEIRTLVPQPSDGEGKIRRNARLRFTYPCAKCGENSAVAAYHCEIHDKYYPAEAADGGRGHCPDCPQ